MTHRPEPAPRGHVEAGRFETIPTPSSCRMVSPTAAG